MEPSPPATACAPPASRYRRLALWLAHATGLGGHSPKDILRSAAVLAVAVSCAVISYDRLYRFALDMGFPGFPARLFPVGLDAAVLGFTRAWFNRRLSADTIRFARASAVFFIAASILGNAIEDARTTTGGWAPSSALSPADWAWLCVTIVFSALMPLGLGLSLHLIAKIADDIREQRDAETARGEAAEAERLAAQERERKAAEREAKRAKSKRDEPVPEPVKERTPEVGPVPTERPDWMTQETAREAMLEYLRRYPDTGGAQLDRFVGPFYGTKKGYGRTVRREWMSARTPAAAGGE